MRKKSGWARIFHNSKKFRTTPHRLCSSVIGWPLSQLTNMHSSPSPEHIHFSNSAPSLALLLMQPCCPLTQAINMEIIKCKEAGKGNNAIGCIMGLVESIVRTVYKEREATKIW